MAPSGGCSRSGGRPYALVWSPIPLISWLMPFIGHLGVCSSYGRTYDFAGPYTVNEDCLLFGMPTRYLPLLPAAAAKGSRRGDAAPPGAGGESGKGTPPGDVEAVAAGTAGTAAAKGTAAAGRPYGAAAGDGGGGGGAVSSAASWDQRLSFAATTYRLLSYNLMTNNCHCFVAHFLNQLAYRGGGWDMVNLAALVFIQGRYTSLGGVLYTWLPWAILVGLGVYFGRVFFLLCYAATCAPLLVWFLSYTWCCWRDLSF